MLRTHKTSARNRSIYVARISGQAVDELAKEYGLAPGRIRAILTSERHQIAVSSDPVYCELRDRFDPAISTASAERRKPGRTPFRRVPAYLPRSYSY